MDLLNLTQWLNELELQFIIKHHNMPPKIWQSPKSKTTFGRLPYSFICFGLIVV